MQFLAVAAAVAAASPALAQLPNSTHGYPVGQAPSRPRTAQRGVMGDWIHNNQGRVYTQNGQVVNGRVVNGRVMNGQVMNGQRCVQRTDPYGRPQTVCSNGSGVWNSRANTDHQRGIERERQVGRQQQIERERQIERDRQIQEQREAQLERDQRQAHQSEVRVDRQRDHREDQNRKWEQKHGRGHGNADHDADNRHGGQDRR